MALGRDPRDTFTKSLKVQVHLVQTKSSTTYPLILGRTDCLGIYCMYHDEVPDAKLVAPGCGVHRGVIRAGQERILETVPSKETKSPVDRNLSREDRTRGDHPKVGDGNHSSSVFLRAD